MQGRRETSLETQGKHPHRLPALCTPPVSRAFGACSRKICAQIPLTFAEPWLPPPKPARHSHTRLAVATSRNIDLARVDSHNQKAGLPKSHGKHSKGQISTPVCRRTAPPPMTFMCPKRCKAKVKETSHGKSCRKLLDFNEYWAHVLYKFLLVSITIILGGCPYGPSEAFHFALSCPYASPFLRVPRFSKATKRKAVAPCWGVRSPLSGPRAVGAHSGPWPASSWPAKNRGGEVNGFPLGLPENQVVLRWMDKILHQFDTIGSQCWLVFAGESSFPGFLGCAGFRAHPKKGEQRLTKSWSSLKKSMNLKEGVFWWTSF